MYVFGADIPIVEFFVIFTLIMGLFFIAFVWLLYKTLQINKKLDAFAVEEKKDLYMMEDVIQNLNKFESMESNNLKFLGQILGIVQKTKMPTKIKTTLKTKIVEHKDSRSKLLEQRQMLKKKISDYYKGMRKA